MPTPRHVAPRPAPDGIPARTPGRTPNQPATLAFLCGALAAFVAAALVAPVLEPSLVLAQTKAPPAASPATPPAKPAAPAAGQPAPAAAQPAVPNGPGLAIMIQNVLLALNHANITGNYTVLRELAAPAFQAVNTPASLAESFTDLRRRNIDLSPIVLFQPKLVREPAIDDKGMLRIVGFYDTQPEQVQFELLFARLGPQWRLYGLAVQTVAAQTAANQPPAGKGAPAAKDAPPPAKK